MTDDASERRCLIFLTHGHDHVDVDVLNRFAISGKMHVVDVLRSNATAAASDATQMSLALEDLLRRKREQNDYNVLLVSDLNRLTKDDGLELLATFEAAGVAVRVPRDQE